MSDNNNNSKNDDDDDNVGCSQQPTSRMVMELQGFSTGANGLKNIMSPAKHVKRRSKQPREIYVPSDIAVTRRRKNVHFLRLLAQGKRHSRFRLIQVTTTVMIL